MTSRTNARLALATFLGLVLVAGWIGYKYLYCWYEMFGGDIKMRVNKISRGCGVVVLPEGWRWKRSVSSDELEFRRSPGDRRKVFVAGAEERYQDMSRECLVSENKFSFSLQDLSDDPSKVVRGLRRVSAEEWSAGERLDRVSIRTQIGSQFSEYLDSGAPIEYKGKLFYKSETYYYDVSRRPAFLSPDGRRIAVLSYGRPKMRDPTGSWPSFNGDLPFMPWRTFATDIYDVSTGSHERRIRGWCCVDTGAYTGAWHGSVVYSAWHSKPDLEIVVCGFE